MALSARNHLPGKIKEIHFGGIMAHIVVKSTEVMIQKD